MCAKILTISKEWTEEEIDFLKNNYINMSREELANALNRTKPSIQNKMKRLKLKKESKYIYDKDYFKDINTEEKAYWLGFISADGYVNYSIQNRNYELGIELCVKDKDHLKKFNKSIGGNIQVGERTRFSFGKYINNCFIRIYDKELVEDLSKYYVVNSKSTTIKIPKLKDEFMIPYIRGYFDGNGCIKLDKSKRYFSFDFCSASIEILNQIKEYLYNKFELKSHIYKETVELNVPVYRLYFRGKFNAPQFGNTIYGGATIYLDRKYNYFINKLHELNKIN